MVNKAIFWDFDGTLVYSNESFLCSLTNALNKYNYQIEKSIIKEFLASVCSWYIPQRDYTNMTGEKWWRELLANLKLFCDKYDVGKKDCELICKAFKDNVINYEYKLYDDSENILSYCKLMGYNNFILSNNFPELIKVIERLGLAKYLRIILSRQILAMRNQELRYLNMQ